MNEVILSKSLDFSRQLLSRLPCLFLRHGILSRPQNLQQLEKELGKIPIPQLQRRLEVDNRRYLWRRDVVESGKELAEQVLETCHSGRRPIFVGHSQGGLVCRVAVTLLCGKPNGWPDSSSPINPRLAKTMENMTAWQKKNNLPSDKLGRPLGVVLLATPNSGSVTWGQLSASARLLFKGVKEVSELVGVGNLQDLTTDRLPRALQYWRVQGIPYLSVSGSKFNRWSSYSHSDLSSIPYIGRLAPNLDLPNDGIVEDKSVDLGQLPLPHEVAGPYEHTNRYRNCTDVSHTDIHKNAEVVRVVSEAIKCWIDDF